MTEVGRLTRRPEFLRVAAARRKWATPGLILQARRREPEAACEAASAPIRLGLTVSRKVGNAVQRNRARRRLRAAAREVLPHEGRPGFDYVVIGRRGTLTRPYQDLLEDLRSALRRLNDAPAGSGGKSRRRSRRGGAGGEKAEA